MALLQVRMSAQLLEAIDQAAASSGLGRCEFVRGVLVAALTGQAKDRHLIKRGAAGSAAGFSPTRKSGANAWSCPKTDAGPRSQIRGRYRC
jgi:hypothetical protein